MRTEPRPFVADPTSANSDAWAKQAGIGRQLAAWSLVSIGAGSAAALVGHLRGNPAVRAFGTQNAAWGVVDLAIAGLGELGRRRRIASLTDPHDQAVQAEQWRSLRRILLVNAGLDVGYVAAGLGGLAWSLRGRPPRPAAAGHAAAVVVQGGFLLAFDAGHAMSNGL